METTCSKCKSKNILETRCVDIDDETGEEYISDSLWNATCLNCGYQFLIVDLN